MNPSAHPAVTSTTDTSRGLRPRGGKWGLDFPRNHRPTSLSNFASLASMLATGLLFIAGLTYLALGNPAFSFLRSPANFPWQLWTILLTGADTTAGGIGDWLFHRRFLVVGPSEHHSHLLALATGGVPLFLLLAFAARSPQPAHFLLPLLAVTLYITALICFDEFVFHRHRCGRIETLFHRLLVFGNAAAFLAWVDWCFTRQLT